MKNNLFKLSIIKHSLVVLVAMLFAFLNIGFFVEITEALPNQLDPSRFVIFDGTYDWDDTIVDKTESTDYITYTEYRDTICTAGASSCDTTKIIRFDTAEELYRFSVDVSFSEVYITGNPTEDVKLSDAKIEEVLDQHYVLGSNIDYSVMKSKTFIPIGYIFADANPSSQSFYERYFTGIFDGQGFEIKNLYLSGHEYLIYEDTSNPETIDIAMTEYYGMFNYNAGVIKNIGFIDMYTELLEMHPDLTKITNVVGFNMPDPKTWTGSNFTTYGSVENIYVIDNRTSVTEAGIRYLVGTSSEDFEASGIVHTNAGNFENSYFVSKVVVNANFINKFTVEPVLFSNNGNVIVDLGEVTQQVVNVTGSSSNLVYDDDVYLDGDVDINNDSITDFTVKVPDPLLATGEPTADLKSGAFTYNSDTWYFYPTDGYPILKGLVYVGGVYQIDDAYDLAFFSKLLNKNTVLNGTDFAHSDYVLTADIDMSVLAPGSYVVPTKIFYGTFSGANGNPEVLTDNFYIYGLTINGGYSVNNEHYTGLFSRLGAGAEVKDIIFSESTINLVNTNSIYSQTFYMGAIAGKMTGATIENVLLDVTLNLGNDALSKTYLGSVVGSGSGIINRVSNQANIDFDSHTFTSEQAVNPEYYIGGIIGATSTDSTLSIYDSLNTGDIYGFETTSDIILTSGALEIDVYIGGIIGKINNTEAAIHNMVAVTNKGNLYAGSVKERTGVPAYQYVGGVFGMLEGKAPILEEGTSYRFANLYNEGEVNYTYTTNTADVISAGIGVSKTSESVEYGLLYNHGTFAYSGSTISPFKYTATIYDISTSSINLTLTRVYNGSCTFDGQGVKTSCSNMNYDSNIYSSISPFMYSDNNNSTLIKYSVNYANINFMNNSGNTTITMSTTLNIAGLTLNTNVNYENVHNYGDINVVNVNLGSNSLYISGFSKQLSTDKHIKNSLNSGNIVFAEMSGSGNIYVAGFVNTNFAGDLQDETQSPTQPIATEGIINSINYGKLNSTYNSTLFGVNGTNNSFVGGLTTFNKGSIQDSTNLGDISVANTNTSATATFYPSDSGSYEGGLIQTYTGGVVIGGVSAMILDGNSRIYDSSNKGDIISRAYRFARAGGVLGVSLYQESIAGGITSGMGLVDTIEESVLSNGLNLGDISALTNIIVSYSTASATRNLSLLVGNGVTFPGQTYNRPISLSYSDTIGTEQRIPVQSSAGGVIGYGLSVMKNMLNHGTISSTDVAGGVVGATFVLGGSNSPVTIVNITTAVNYGNIKSILTSSLSSLQYNNLTMTSVSSLYMADGNTFIFPTTYTKEAPRNKRGFGGIFGRLQRGNLGAMSAEGGSFDFIVNANPNIDLIGRIDQVGDFSNTVTAYRFNGAIVYSAKLNDTTQKVFTGFTFNGRIITQEVSYLGYERITWGVYEHEFVVNYQEGSFRQQGTTMTQLSFGSTGQQTALLRSSSTSKPNPLGVIINGSGSYVYSNLIPWITEDPNDVNLTEDWTDPLLGNEEREYMYGPYFPMRVEEDLTKFIYYAEYDLLADRFRSISDGGTGTNVRENGMYVLSTTAGQEFGAVLPRNISPADIELINEDLNLSIIELDYDNLAPSQTNNLYQPIIDQYEALYQTRYNDKAELTESSLQNLTLVEDGGSNTILSLPDIDYDNKEITFTISMEAFNPSLNTASFNIYDALISSNALIGVRPADFTMDDLIITEYIEGSSFNKAIEIYNGTGSSVDLSTYSIQIYYNGNITPGSTINLSGSLANGEVFVVAHTSANATILAAADLTTGSYSPNGNDAIVLRNGSAVIDSIGEVGDDTVYAEDVTLTRKLLLRDTNHQDSYSVEYYWETYDIDTANYIGDYTFDLESLSSLLYFERYDEISTDYPALLDITLPSQSISSETTPQSLGYFSVYSEAFINDPIFAETFYYNDYQVFIIFTPNINNTGGTTGIQYVSFNGGGNTGPLSSYTNPQPSSIDISGNGDVTYNGSLKLIFNDGKGVLNEGYDFIDNFKLYYMDGVSEVEVDMDHYSVSSVAVTAGGIYEITFNFSDALLKGGNYRIKYSYFSASTVYTVNFDKAASNQAIIEDLDYYSYDDDFSPSGTSFTTYISMGKVPSIDGTTSNFTTQTIDPLNPLYREYLSNAYYDISFMYADSFAISNFATVTRAQLTNTTYSNGYKTYTIQYDITAENGSTTQTFTHTIIERTVELTAAYKDGNDVPLDNITTTREALTTRFEIDLGFDTSDDMSGPVDYSVELTDPEHIEISVVGVDFALQPITNIVGLTYSSNDYLIIDMGSETLPGTYTFTLTYNRGVTVGTITFAELEITKLEGTSAYLTDIKFTPIASESKYPTMDITNAVNGDITQIYNPAVYFFGIDYDGADEIDYEYFRVYGQVNNIPLESYYPYMLDYLPLGATVSRYDPTRSDWSSNGYYSPEVNNLSTEEEKGVLAADFTEVVGEDNIFIRYRVTSEDGNSQVYYNIKVNDITYNVTLIFDIYYCDDQDVCVLAKDTSEFTEVVQINVYNLYVHSKDSTFADPNPDENNPLYYPTFSRVSGEYNSMTQFIYTDASDYNYRFGRNRAGFYIFEVVLPYDQYLNDMYTYEIDFTTFTLDDVDDLTFTSSKDYNGKYYYITYSEANRTRRFDIKIYRADVTGDKPFGLFDFFRTWS
jgi:hypothetical protein